MTVASSNFSRRQFLSMSSIALTTPALVKVPGGFIPSDGDAQTKGKTEILYRTLGRTGLKVPIVNMGVMNADNPEVVKASYEAGVRLFDTAMGYQGGRNEEMIGDVISRLGVRDKVIIQTKVPGRTGAARAKERFMADFEGCLKRLKTDYVDGLLMHGATPAEMSDPGIIEALTELKKLKQARYLGVSAHQGQTEVLNAAAKSEFYDVIQVSINFTNADDSALLDAVKNAAAKRIGIIAMKTQGGGRRPRNAGPINHTAALKWILHHQEITTAIPGYTNFDHMKEDFSVAYGIEYTEEEKRFLADKNIQASVQFCRQCGECVSGCPNGVDIPTLMRTHMYADRYSNFYQARATLEGIDGSRGIGRCRGCVTCSARCVRSVEIARNIEDLKSMYLVAS